MCICFTGEKFQGVAVIVTVPLGCLKTGDIAFKPSLPAWKLDAIEKLGFGNLNKGVEQHMVVFPVHEYLEGCRLNVDDVAFKPFPPACLTAGIYCTAGLW